MKGKGGSIPLIICLSVQAILLLVMAFIPFGFDHPSSWGLDFGHFLSFALGYGLALLLGLGLAATQKNRAALLGQLVGPLVAAVVGLLLQGR